MHSNRRLLIIEEESVSHLNVPDMHDLSLPMSTEETYVSISALALLHFLPHLPIIQTGSASSASFKTGITATYHCLLDCTNYSTN